MQMKIKYYLLAVILCCPFLNAQNKWEAKKVFELDIDSIYNFYIDTIDANDGVVDFCFQTMSDNLVKTDANGTKHSITNNPYKYFYLLNSDTIILGNHSVIKNNRDTICVLPDKGTASYLSYIAASSNGTYVYYYAGWGSFVYNVGKQSGDSIKVVFASSPLSGLCCYGGYVYGIESYDNVGILLQYDEINKAKYTQNAISIKSPVGIAGYGGYLYFFSNTDKTLYRLESSDETATHSIINSKIEREASHYGADGRIINPTTRGIHIVKSHDGSVYKYIER